MSTRDDREPRARVRGGPRRADADFHAEVQAHLDLETDRLIADGLPPDDARAAARRAFGSVLGAHERFHESHRTIWLEQFLRDVRYAWRGLWRSPAFVATTVLTLAVGIGLVTVLFTVFNAYVLRPFAVRDPYSLYGIGWRAPDANGGMFRWSDYEELRDRRDLFDAAIAQRGRLVTSNGRYLAATFVSGNFFETLGAPMRLGRPLTPADARVFGGEPVAVLSDHAWTRVFDRDPTVIGRELDVNGERLTIIGVLRPEFSGLDPDPRDLWMPMTMHDVVVKQSVQTSRALSITVRLRRDVTPERVESALASFAARAAHDWRSSDRTRPHRADGMDAVRAELDSQATSSPLTLDMLAMLSPVFAAFGLVLVAACANVSNVMLARANARHREIAVRLSLGASRGRVVRQLLTEGLLIALLAGVAGLAIAAVTLRTGTRLFFATLPTSIATIGRIAPLDFDHRVFLFALIVSALASVMFALLPALQATRLTLTHALRGEAGAAWRSSTLRHLLIVGQVAVSLVLLVGAATLIRNGSALEAIDLGLVPHGVTTIAPRVQADATPVTSTNATLLARAAAALSADPRIEQVAVATRHPLSELSRLIAVASTNTSGTITVPYRFVSGEYFSVLRIPLVRGRVFRPEEDRSEAPVAIVSAATAKLFWPDADPIGQTLRVHRSTSRELDDLPGYSDVVVVGVVGDVVSEIIYEGVDRAHVYLPTSATGSRAQSLLVRARSQQDLTLDTLQALLRPVHPDPFAFESLPLNEMVEMQMYPLRAASFIGSVLGGIALALSVTGLYGVLTYMLGQRTREIGIRMALGATATTVVRLVMSQSARLAGIGAAFGLIVAFAVVKTLSAFVQLHATTVVDPGAFILGVLLVMAATAIAAYFPARRATRVDPAKTLRADA